MKTDGLNDIFAELKQEYLDSFDQKIETIETFWQSGQRPLLKMEFHKLKGTGATYGLPQISSVAEIMEKLCINNSASLGHALLIAIRLFNKIKESELTKNDFELSDDEDFQKLASLHKNQQCA